MQAAGNFSFRILLITLCWLLSPIAHAETVLQAQLEILERELDGQRKLNKIPGLAIAVVKDGEVVYAKGLGFKDVKKQQPATKNSLFSIGSVSKPITAMLAGMRVDDGVIDWDDKLADYLPDYQFSHNGKTVPLTLRDALSHKTGYGRNDTLWANSKTSRLDIIKAAPKATPVAKYGTEYHYNNVMYLAAGMATAYDSHFNWDDLLQDRLLTPLKMTSTTGNYEKVINDPRLSKGYYWNDIAEQFRELPLKDLHNIAPAGGIYSNVKDMAKWLQLMLNKGKFGDKQRIKTETLHEITSPMNNVSPTFDYGMGWNLTQYNGELLIEHAGSIEGHSAQVALLPESGLGFVLLMNVSLSPLQPASINLVFDALTTEPVPDKVSSTPDYSQYEGDYLANFWQFQNVYFSFKVKGNKPAINIPGQTLYMLRPPNEEGKFYFELTDKVAISFQLNDQGEVLNMVHHEEGQAFILPKKAPEQTQDTKPAPSKAVLALYDTMHIQQQKQAFEKLGKIEMTGSVHQKQSGVKGTFCLISNGLNWQIEQDFAGIASLSTQVDAATGFNKRLRHEYSLTGYLHEQAMREHPFHFLYWDHIYQGIAVSLPSDEKPQIEGNTKQTKRVSVSLGSKALSDARAVVNAQTGHVHTISMQFIDPVWGQYPRELTYLDYQDYCGLAVPRQFIIDDHETGKSIFTVSNVSAESCNE